MVKIVSFRPSEKIISYSDIINIPLVKIRKNNFNYNSLNLRPGDALVFTSSEGSRDFTERFNGETHGLFFFAIGDKTAEPLIKKGLKVMIPDIKDSRGLVELILDKREIYKRLFLLRSEIHNKIIDNELSSRSIPFFSYNIYCYEELDVHGKLNNFDPDDTIFIFSSSLQVKVFKKNTESRYLKSRVVAIGRPTRETLELLGYKNIIMEGESDFTLLIKKLVDIN
ncbi:uroporphyrinogen-III synthase [Caldiplasma sukawensis]